MTPGDGIGPEVMTETRRVLGWFAVQVNRNIAFETEEAAIGGIAYETLGTSEPDETIAKAKKADAVLFGAVGGPKWDSLPFDKKPERGLLRLRKDLSLFANLRPALCFDALKDASSLKPELVAGLDILIVRELTGGVYFGEPKEITTLPNGEKRAVDTQVYTTSEIERIARVAFELARLARQPRAVGGEEQCDGHGRVVETGRAARARQGISRRCRCPTCWPMRWPCSWCAGPSSSTSSSPTICSAISCRTRRRS